MRLRRWVVGLVAGALVGMGVVAVQADDSRPPSERPAKNAKAPAIEGRWTVVEAKQDGEEQPDGGQATFVKGILTIEEASGHKKEASYRVDGDRAPYLLDLTPRGGKHKGETFKALFTIQDNKLTIAMGGPGADRPKESALKDGANCLRIVLEREKP